MPLEFSETGPHRRVLLNEGYLQRAVKPYVTEATEAKRGCLITAAFLLFPLLRGKGRAVYRSLAPSLARVINSPPLRQYTP